MRSRKESSSNPERKSTATLNPIWAASIQRNDPRRPECCLAPDVRAPAGVAKDARNAGTIPNRSVVSRHTATSNPIVLASGETSSQAGNSVGPETQTTDGRQTPFYQTDRSLREGLSQAGGDSRRYNGG